MKVYQLIYTSVLHSLSDPELGLTNQSGLRVFSCTQGLTKQNVEETIRFATYRLPKNNEIQYSEKPCDPSVPEMFPKIFRTFRLSDGRYVAMQISYAGCDFDGQHGNVFAHAFIFDDVDDNFLPERYIGHKMYRTHLTEKDLSGQIVHYLKPVDGIAPSEGVENEIIDFIGKHKTELTYILDRALTLLTSGDIKNICIASSDAELVKNYLLALKWLLPTKISENTGISTYNVYLPSDKQDRIVFHGTVKEHNNITAQAIETRKNCIYIDIENTKFKLDEKSKLLDFEVTELREIYQKYKFTSITQLLAWEATLENVAKTGIAARMLKLKKSAGDEAFKKRMLEIYPSVKDLNMANVRFELSKIMFDNINLFPNEKEYVTDIYIGQCIEKLCTGENVEFDNLLSEGEYAKNQAEAFKTKLPEYMKLIRADIDNISEKGKTSLLVLLGQVKHYTETDTWKALLADKDDLKCFVLLASQIVIKDTIVNPFETVDGWNKEDLAELVAYFEASTNDDRLKKHCVKYICSHNTDWSKYGVLKTRHPKTKGEKEKDLQKIRRMLSRVGYIPYQRLTYASLKAEVKDDIENSNSPLLISRLLYAFYRWQGTYGNQIQAEKYAGRVKALLMEMRKTQTSCFNYMIPKLALEIIESPGHYHEIMINTETMPPSFWNWFLIGYNKNKKNDDKRLAYTRVYGASKARMAKVPAKKKIRETFADSVE